MLVGQVTHVSRRLRRSGHCPTIRCRGCRSSGGQVRRRGVGFHPNAIEGERGVVLAFAGLVASCADSGTMNLAVQFTLFGPTPARIDDAIGILLPRLVILFCPPDTGTNERTLSAGTDQRFCNQCDFRLWRPLLKTDSRRTGARWGGHTEPADQRYGRRHQAEDAQNLQCLGQASIHLTA